MLMFNAQKKFFKAARTGDDATLHMYCTAASKKIDINALDTYRNAALHLATEGGHVEALRTLLRFHANTEVENHSGHTPLMIAAKTGKRACLSLLLAHGANPNAHDGKYVYPLHDAAFLGDLDAVKALLDAGAHVDPVISNNSRTPLHWAADKGMNAVAALLVERGASLTAQDDGGRTALDIARKKNHPHIVSLLEAALREGAGAPDNAARPSAPPDNAARAGTPQPSVNARTAEQGGQDDERWALAGSMRVAHIGHYPDINRRLTEIFNFESRERILISENLKTGAETMSAPESFDALQSECLDAAYAAYKRLGGTAVHDAPSAVRLQKPAALKKP